MRIGQNNQYLTQYVNSESKNLSKKDTSQIFSIDLAKKSSEESNKKLGSSPFFQFISARSNTIPQSENIQTTSSNISAENDTDIEIDEDMEEFNKCMEELGKKRTAMNNLLEKFGINGQVRGISETFVPNHYSMYYIETEDDTKNLFIIELENGKFVFTETEQTENEVRKLLHEKIYELLGPCDLSNPVKLSVDELKKMFAKIFNVDELKDFILEFSRT